MTQKEKLLLRAINNPADLSFEDFKALLKHSSWILDHQTGSHQIWYSPKKCRISIQNNKGTKNMKTHDAFDGFSIHLLYDENDDDWVAHFVELPTVSAFGDTPEKSIEELKVAWEGVKQSYINKDEEVPVAPSKKTYSGQFNVRIDKRLHKALAIEACQVGVSLNALVAQKLAQGVGVHVD